MRDQDDSGRAETATGSPGPRRGALRIALAVALALGGLGAAAPAGAQESAEPKRHFRVERPASLSDADALSIYSQILDEIVGGYRLSRDPTAADYRSWRRYNKAPYRSATHGERFVSNYANGKAERYRLFEQAGTMPEGSILAKDSFAVTSRGDVFTGPLFLMEKMAKGFNDKSRDWRYGMIMPDGSLFGVTKGPGSARVEFCITCHASAGDKNDHMFFVPEAYRARILRVAPE